VEIKLIRNLLKCEEVVKSSFVIEGFKLCLLQEFLLVHQFDQGFTLELAQPSQLHFSYLAFFP
jgi:hypothetical protein